MLKKKLIIAALSALVFSCAEKEEPINPTQEKTIYLSVNDLVNITDSPLGGKMQNEESDPTYYAIEIRNGEAIYASGVYEDLSEDIALKLLDNTEYTVEVKAIQTGTGPGVYIEEEGGLKSINLLNWTVINNSLEYIEPEDIWITNSSTYMKTTIDGVESSVRQNIPELNTFYTELTFNSADIVDVLEINLSRAVFGIDINVLNLTQGTIDIELGSSSPTKFHMTPENFQSSHILTFDSVDPWFISVNSGYDLRIVYNDGVEETVIFNNTVDFNLLQAKKIEIDMATAASGVNGNLRINLLDEAMTEDAEIIEVK